MQLKGLVRFFTIAMIVVCIYQLVFTYVAGRYEKKASSYAMNRVKDNNCESLYPNDVAAQQQCIEAYKSEQKQKYLDSMDNEVALNYFVTKYTLGDCRNQQLSLGLDLQ